MLIIVKFVQPSINVKFVQRTTHYTTNLVYNVVFLIVNIAQMLNIVVDVKPLIKIVMDIAWILLVM